MPAESLSHKLTPGGCAPVTEAPVLETISAFYTGCELDSCATHRRGTSSFTLSPVLQFHSYSVWLRIKLACSCGVSVPGVRFVDAANGVLGIEWVNGRSVRFLLGSGNEDEEADNDYVDPLVEYGVSKGTISHSLRFCTRIFLMGWEQKH